MVLLAEYLVDGEEGNHQASSPSSLPQKEQHVEDSAHHLHESATHTRHPLPPDAPEVSNAACAPAALSKLSWNAKICAAYVFHPCCASELRRLLRLSRSAGLTLALIAKKQSASAQIYWRHCFGSKVCIVQIWHVCSAQFGPRSLS